MKTVVDYFCGLMFAAGILLAGSDGPWMPLPNAAGGLILLALLVYVKYFDASRPAPRR